MSSDNKVFTDGLFFDRRDGAPDFVIGQLTFSVERFVRWLEAQPTQGKGYVKVDLKRSRAGKVYGELDTWTPPKSADAARYHVENSGDDDGIPF